jgi:hypothetical protein
LISENYSRRLSNIRVFTQPGSFATEPSWFACAACSLALASRKADGYPSYAGIVTLNVTVTSAISALRKHEQPSEIGDIVEVLEAWEIAQVAQVRQTASRATTAAFPTAAS